MLITGSCRLQVPKKQAFSGIHEMVKNQRFFHFGIAGYEFKLR